MNMPLYRLIAQAISARNECTRTDNPTWHERWSCLLDHISKDLLPHGSGIDSGCNIDPSSTEEKIVILSSVHMMNDVGMYDSWQDFRVTIRPSFQGIRLKITRMGNGNRMLWMNWIDALYDEFDICLKNEVEWNGEHICFSAQKQKIPA